jgi:hypothetical protein
VRLDFVLQQPHTRVPNISVCHAREQFGKPNATIVHDPAKATEAMLLQVKAD